MNKKIVKIISVIIVLSLLAAVFTSCNFGKNEIQSETRTVVDSVGRTVAVPKDPQMICTLSSFAGPLVCMYGFADKMMATCNNVLRDTFLKTICPALNNAINVKDSGTMNAESILALNCEIIFVDKSMYEDADEKQKLETMGIPYVVVDFVGMESQINAALVVGKALGCDDEAERFAAYYRAAINDTKTVLDGIENRTVYSVYHSINEITRTDDAGSLGAEWTAAAGANNVSVGGNLTLSGDKTTTSIEQLLAWNPDVIICNEPGVDDIITEDSRFAGIAAVQSGKVYQIPVGITRYGHPNGIETPLAILWLAKTLYPDAFEYKIEDKMKEFYLTFFDYTVSDETIADIIQGDDIRTPKTNSSSE